MSLALGLSGCGGMGHRHVLGLKRLRDVDRLQLDLVAVCDPVPEAAAHLAETAAELLDRRPQVFATLAELQRAVAIDALDVTTSPDLHAEIAVAALETGVHVMVEKPIALTVRQGLRMVQAAATARVHLAVAENYRRDPINRLARTLLDAGAIGRPFLIVQSSSGSGERVIITPWRHLRRSGGIVIDMGVHYADLLEYFLGPVTSVAGLGAVVDPKRRDAGGAWHEVDAEDLTVGVIRFASGALGNLLLNLAARGASDFSRVIYGTGGTLAIPPDRSGKPLQLTQRQNGADRSVPPEAQLGLVPDFALDAATAALFGGERLATYDMDWTDIDASLLAIELDDFTRAILDNRPPEVGGIDGLRALALIYGFLESDRLSRFLTMDELLGGELAPYQQAIMTAAGVAG